MDERTVGTLILAYGVFCFYFAIAQACAIATDKWRWTWNWVILNVLFLPGAVALVMFSLVTAGLIWAWDRLDVPVGKDDRESQPWEK